MKLIEITTSILEDERIRHSDFLSVVCRSTLAMYPAGGPVVPWVGYLAEEDGEFVGTCAFKSPPGEHGVEIAYFTFPEHEGRGLATRMAAELVAIATRAGARTVRAQTLPEVNASTKILEKLGFSNGGSVMHPEDGEVWEWTRTAVGKMGDGPT
jgi:RimJ/RimL family protein N-acetyltransferase